MSEDILNKFTKLQASYEHLINDFKELKIDTKGRNERLDETLKELHACKISVEKSLDITLKKVDERTIENDKKISINSERLDKLEEIINNLKKLLNTILILMVSGMVSFIFTLLK